jgi:hypothetical protein
MQIGESARRLVQLGCLVLALAALAGVWEILASQAPGTPLYIGMLPAPIERLREATLTWGVLIVCAGLVLGERALPARSMLGLYLGLALALGASLYAGVSGMPGVQAWDLRPDATWVFAIKFIGRALLVLSLADVARRALARTRSGP